MVRIALPPPSKPPSPLFRTLAAGTSILRIFDPTRYGTTALTFRYYGPIGRFDHQRLALGGCPADRSETRQRPLPEDGCTEDLERGISYAGLTLSCCLVECFGDSGVIELKGQQIGRIQIERELNLLDLRGNGAMRAGSVAALAKTADRQISQEWSRYFYERTELYGLIDGISYFNAHNDEEAFALYERAQSALVCPDSQILSLNHSSLRPAIQQASLANHLDFLP
jgi:RES domain